MIISDLSYLNEIVEENVSGAGYNIDFKKRIDVKVDIDVDSKVDAKGAVNEVAFDLTALGRYGSGTEVQTTQIAAYDKGYYVSSNVGSVTSFAY